MKMDVYDRAASDYLSELKGTGMSEKTIQNYGNAIRYFRDFCEANCETDEPKATDVRAWRDSMMESGTSKTSIHQYMVRLNCFFEFACSDDITGECYFSANPVLKRLMPNLKGEDTKPYDKILSTDDLKKLWVNRKCGSDKMWARNYAIITLLLDGKIRNAELLELRLSDVHFATEEENWNDILVRHGKGNKYRYVDLSEISVSALKLYLASGIRPDDLSDDDYLFGTTAEKAFGGTKSGFDWHKGSSQWLSKTVEKHVRKVTGKSGFRTHSMRHNGAIMELNNGVSLERIQQELGHSSVATTEIYAGRLRSKRNAVDMSSVYAVRDEWAERNNRKLATV